MQSILSQALAAGGVLRWLPGKTSFQQQGAWLPSWRHMLDTAQIMERLVLDWLPDAARASLGVGMDEDEAVRVATFVALVHDYGKLTPLFVSNLLPQLPDVRQRLEAMGLSIPPRDTFPDGRQSPHALAGAALLNDKQCPPGITAIVGAHHGAPMPIAPCLKEQLRDYPRNYDGRLEKENQEACLWRQARASWLQFALAYCGYGSAEELPTLSCAAQMLLTGLLVMADWIASNPNYFPLLPQEEAPTCALDEARAERAWTRLRLPERWLPDCFVMDQALFAERFGFAPNAVQAAVMKVANAAVQPGIFILEAQMGVGKTEAALAATEVLVSKSGAGGVFFGLPTQATANGIFPRLMGWAQRQPEASRQAIRLAHGAAALNADYQALFDGSAATEDGEKPDGLTVHRWFEGRKQALLADFVIGTVDQVLMAALKQRHVMLRHLGLAGKAVIIDECHAYDAYMGVYLKRALTWLGSYHVPVILLSATLPARQRAALVEAYLGHSPSAPSEDWRVTRAYPLLTWTDGNEVNSLTIPSAGKDGRTVYIDRLESTDAESDGTLIADYLRRRLAGGGCALVIVNTVRRAQGIARALREQLADKEILLAHAHFLMEDRAEWEQTLLARMGKRSTPQERDGLIVVGTQVLEQSLDLDADVMVTDLCPMDLLLQRLGRLHRHLRARPADLRTAKCAILLPAGKDFEPGAEKIYGKWLLMRTLRRLPERIELPRDIPTLVQDVYDEPEALNDEGEAAYESYRGEIHKQEARAEGFLLGKPKVSARRPWMNTLNGMLDKRASDDERHGDASVRDGEPSIEVLVMVRHPNGDIGFVPWREGGRIVSRDCVPSREDARAIALQRVRLPRVVCGISERDIEHTIHLLEEDTRRSVPEWVAHGLLGGELFLFLDEAGQARLNGKRLTYQQGNGLRYDKEEQYVGSEFSSGA